MFKGILPSKRIVSSDFTMVTPVVAPTANGTEKENEPDSFAVTAKPSRQAATSKAFSQVFEKQRDKEPKVSKEKEKLKEEVPMNEAFDKLLDNLQIPSTLRPKLAGMDATVKAAMLKSSHVMTMNPPPPQPPTAIPLPPSTTKSKLLRKTRSIDSITSPKPVDSSQYDFPRPPPMSALTSVAAFPSASVGASSALRLPSGHSRGVSFSAANTSSRGQSLSTTADVTFGKAGKEKAVPKNISPANFCSILASKSSTSLEVENVKKLRLLLRNESASWSQEFLRLGGYASLLTRLNEILEVEWREEQHDDQILHELLRCIKGLSTSEIGCFALRSSCPTPFVQLVSLLYSDKKPGDVATRQLIIDLLLLLFSLYPSDSLPGRPSNSSPTPWSTSPPSLIILPPPHHTLFSLIRALLLTPAPPPSESPASPVSPHAFIEVLHTPRIYKTYLSELSDVCRDYFWVFCHPNNTIWCLADVDEGKVEAPRPPGGMTGGVEFEAMGYLTTHFKLLNAIAKTAADLKLPKEDDHSAYRFHSDLFLSGIERILLVARKASTTYYPTLHLEISRYMAFTGGTGYDVPWAISRLVGPPPAVLCKPGRASRTGTPKHSPVKTPRTGANGAPKVPTPKKVEAIKFD